MKEPLKKIFAFLKTLETLRHRNPATTQIYTATLNEERRLQNSGEA
jgi:hypothetical protein